MENLFCVNRVAFSINGYDIYWYGIMMCLAIISAIAVATYFCYKRNLPKDTAINVAIVSIPFGILGARLFAVLFDSDLSISEFFNFRTGGLSIIGSIIGGGIALTIYSIVKCKKLESKDYFIYCDLICSVLLLAQAIGRWGNFFNGEVYGQDVSSISYLNIFPFSIEISGGTRVLALFFIESVLDFVGFIFAARIFLALKKDGYTTGYYLMYYGLIRTILEKFRQSEFILKLGNLPISMICSAIMFFAGLAIMIISVKRVKNQRNKNNEKTV